MLHEVHMAADTSCWALGFRFHLQHRCVSASWLAGSTLTQAAIALNSSNSPQPFHPASAEGPETGRGAVSIIARAGTLSPGKQALGTHRFSIVYPYTYIELWGPLVVNWIISQGCTASSAR